MAMDGLLDKLRVCNHSMDKLQLHDFIITAGRNTLQVEMDGKTLHGLTNVQLTCDEMHNTFIKLEILPEFVDLVCEAAIETINGVDPEVLDKHFRYISEKAAKECCSVEEIIEELNNVLQ